MPTAQDPVPAAFRRSEAFAEDIEGLLSSWQPPAPEPRRGRLLVNLLPLAVAMAGLAFAVMPPPG